ncbi:transposase [bacterium]|nr:transposase [bacterium]
MSQEQKPNPEVQPKATRRRFTAEYKRRIVAEAEQCQHGELGSLLRREGLTYGQIGKWRTAVAEGTVNKKRGPVANLNPAEMRRLEAENERMRRKLAAAEAIVNAQKKLAALLERLNGEEEK